MSKEVTMLFKHFSKVLNEEMKSHGIKARDFMGSCRIGHDRYGKVKKGEDESMSAFKAVVNTFGEFIFDPVELERVRRRLKDAVFDD